MRVFFPHSSRIRSPFAWLLISKGALPIWNPVLRHVFFFGEWEGEMGLLLKGVFGRMMPSYVQARPSVPGKTGVSLLYLLILQHESLH